MVDVLMTYHGHSERILLAVTRLGKQSMILGFMWLRKHNPEIDFRQNGQDDQMPPVLLRRLSS